MSSPEVVLEYELAWEHQERFVSQTATQIDSRPSRILSFPGNQDSLEDTTTTDIKVQNNLWVATQILTDATFFYSKPLVRDTEKSIELLSVLRAKDQGIGIPYDVLQFCIENNLSKSLALARKFVNQCFSGIQALKLQFVVDPEDDEKWVEINITVPDTANFLTEYNNYTRLLVAEIPWPERNMLRFNFNFS